MAKQQEFTCPRCGSHEYGSSSYSGPVVRYCHGTFKGQSCLFGWDEADDSKYFTDTIYDAPEGPFVATSSVAR